MRYGLTARIGVPEPPLGRPAATGTQRTRLRDSLVCWVPRRRRDGAVLLRVVGLQPPPRRGSRRWRDHGDRTRRPPHGLAASGCPGGADMNLEILR
jgi:hypothetical protein